MLTASSGVLTRVVVAHAWSQQIALRTLSGWNAVSSTRVVASESESGPSKVAPMRSSSATASAFFSNLTASFPVQPRARTCREELSDASATLSERLLVCVG